MSNFVTGVGWFVIAALALALACFAICCVLWLYEKAMERFESAVAAKTLASTGRSLGATAWWFSESPDTSLAIRIVAERMVDGRGFDSNQMREQWRKGRAVSATEPRHE